MSFTITTRHYTWFSVTISQSTHYPGISLMSPLHSSTSRTPVSITIRHSTSLTITTSQFTLLSITTRHFTSFSITARQFMEIATTVNHVTLFSITTKHLAYVTLLSTWHHSPSRPSTSRHSHYNQALHASLHYSRTLNDFLLSITTRHSSIQSGISRHSSSYHFTSVCIKLHYRPVLRVTLVSIKTLDSLQPDTSHQSLSQLRILVILH